MRTHRCRELSGRHAMVFWAFGSRLVYRYDDVLGPTDVVAPGLSAELGYRLTTDRLTATVTAGLGLRHSREHPAVGRTVGTTETGVALSGDLAWDSDSLVATLSANYQGADGCWGAHVVRADLSLEFRAGYAMLRDSEAGDEFVPYVGFGLYHAF